MTTSDDPCENLQNSEIPQSKTNGLVKRGFSIKFRFISLNDVIALRKYINEVPDGKDFLIRTIYHQLVNPAFTQEDLKSWTDEELLTLANYYVCTTPAKSQDELAVIGDFGDFRNYIENRISKWTALFKQLSEQSQSGISGVYEFVSSFSKSIYQ